MPVGLLLENLCEGNDFRLFVRRTDYLQSRGQTVCGETQETWRDLSSFACYVTVQKQYLILRALSSLRGKWLEGKRRLGAFRQRIGTQCLEGFLKCLHRLGDLLRLFRRHRSR